MKLLVFFLVASGAFAASWDSVQRLPHDQKIEVTTRDGSHSRSTFVSATPDVLVVNAKSGQQSIARSDVKQVRVSDPARRVRNGLLWTAIGAGAGAGVGFAVCPGCPNEGSGYKYVGPGIAAGAALGALSFLSSPYRTIYKVD